MSDKKIQISIKDFLSDIFDGRTDLELMTKYRISSAVDLYKVFNRLIMMGVVEKDEVKYRLPEGWKVQWKKEDVLPTTKMSDSTLRLDAREIPRKKLFGNVEVCDMMTHSYTRGIEIKDISEFGLMVAPIKIGKNEVRDFSIKTNHLEGIHSISFTADCRWTDGIRAGFKITSISPADMRELRKLIRVFAFEA